MKPVCTIILNRNLPRETDLLYENIKKEDGDITDIYILEAGSDPDNLSKNYSWYANTDEILENGLRYPRGMNYGLVELIKSKNFFDYDSFFLITNDTELKTNSCIKKLHKILMNQSRLGIISPCGEDWGELNILNKLPTKYFWFIHNSAYMIKRKMIEDLVDFSNLNYIDFLFDGNNFRGFGCESELIAKGYINDWASAITKEVLIYENESYLINNSKKIKTLSYQENLSLYISEGEKWMKRKYGFNSKWGMLEYVKSFYEKFFEYHPDLLKYKL